MKNHSLKALKLTCFALFFTLVAAPMAAQERARVQVQEEEPAQVQQVLTAKPAKTERVKRGDADGLKKVIEQCGMPCKMGGSGTIAAPGGGTLDYNCDDDGNCSCFGAKDCVTMTDVCKEGSMGCNKQGCICEKDPDSGG